MKALILNGSRKGDDSLDIAQKVLTSELQNLGWEVKTFMLRDCEIADCTACWGCFVKTPGVCIIDDAARDVVRALVQCDLEIHLTPVTFGGYSSELKKALDRTSGGLALPFFVDVRGEIQHTHRYEKTIPFIGIGVLPEPDEESEKIFTTLLERNEFYSSACASGIVLSTQKDDEIRAIITSLLEKVGVKK